MESLKELDTRAPANLKKDQVKEQTKKLLDELNELQNVFYADHSHALLVILQGMDASGKDGIIRKVMASMNPQGVQVTTFKVPTEEELSHDFLWRIHKHVPARGMIQVFNRSHYEDVLITRVHGICDDETAQKRFAAINDFERLLTRHNNTDILKFYLHISPEEQAERLQERLKDPTKHWKHNPKDDDEAQKWPQYRAAYEDVFLYCNEVPWNIIPSDQNWYKEYLIAKTMVAHFRSLNLKFPELKDEEKK